MLLSDTVGWEDMIGSVHIRTVYVLREPQSLHSGPGIAWLYALAGFNILFTGAMYANFLLSHDSDWKPIRLY